MDRRGINMNTQVRTLVSAERRFMTGTDADARCTYWRRRIEDVCAGNPGRLDGVT